MTAVLDVRGLTVTFGNTDVVHDVSLSLAAGRVTGLIGPNGAGKTTFVDAVDGLVASRGSVILDEARIDSLPAHRRARLGLGRTFQSLELFEDLTVAENVLAATEAAGVGDPAATLASEAMSKFGLDDVASRLPSTLSHASRARLAIARAVATGPRVLLLDEPAAGLDGPGRQALADRVRSLADDDGLAVLLVDHDLALVLDVCNQVVVLDRGAVIASGPPATVRSDPAVVAAYLGAADLPQARRAAVAVSEAGTGDGGVPALKVSGLQAGYAGAAVVHDVGLTVAPGEIVALLGLNGAGKTTVLSAISGLIPRMAGVVKVDGVPLPASAHLVARRGVAHVPEDNPLFAGLSVNENLVLRRAGADSASASAECENRFPEVAALGRRRAGFLSGGEARMVAVCRALAGTPRVLLLDEPSRGLAPKAAGQLASALCSAADNGTAVLLVEQHPALALGIAKRAYLLERGRVTTSGAAREIDIGILLEGSPRS
ncbi:MAG: ATP-binding cassette domain-containing protein [Acidimicrobiales bacterium]